MDSRERIRTLFTNLLAESESPHPPPGTAETSSETPAPFTDDPFGDELFSERAFRKGAEGADAILGDGFDGFDQFAVSGGDGYSSGGDGHGGYPKSAAREDPVWVITEQPPLSAESAAAKPDADGEEDYAGGDMFGLRSADSARTAGPALDEGHVSSGCDATLGALPDHPPTGAHRVVIVGSAELGCLNARLDAGWRVVQMLPSGSPMEFVVALRYVDYAAE